MKRNIRITSPSGKAVWPRVNEPDTKFDKDGIYSITLRLPTEEAEEMVGEITKVLATNLEKQKKEQKGKKVKEAPLPIKDVEEASIGGDAVGVTEGSAVHRGLAASVDGHLGHRPPRPFKDIEVGSICCEIIGAVRSGNRGDLRGIADADFLDGRRAGIEESAVRGQSVSCCSRGNGADLAGEAQGTTLDVPAKQSGGTRTLILRRVGGAC